MNKIIFSISLILAFGCKENSSKKSSTDVLPTNSSEIIQPAKAELGYSNRIVPGNRIGNIVLAKDAASVVDSLGEPKISNEISDGVISIWTQNNVENLKLYTSSKIETENGTAIKAIRSLSDYYKTEDNLGVSSLLSELKRYYRLDPVGKFTFNGKHYYLYTTPKGIAFEIGMNQKCNGVLLYPQGIDPDNLFNYFYTDYKKL